MTGLDLVLIAVFAVALTALVLLAIKFPPR
jgi:hypothetical protein